LHDTATRPLEKARSFAGRKSALMIAMYAVLGGAPCGRSVALLALRQSFWGAKRLHSCLFAMLAHAPFRRLQAGI